MNHAFSLQPSLFIHSVESALREDMRSGDVTSDALIPPDLRARAKMNFRESGTLCGTQVACAAFRLLDDNAEFKREKNDGDVIAAGETVLIIEGNARAILTAERVALNFMQRLSGVATLTRKFVEATEDTHTRLADTRKTTPNLRLLEKYAVRCGGGTNHRFALDDLVLIKDNHIALCGGIEEAVRRARMSIGHALKIEIECDTLEQVQDAIAARADIILLDNMKPETLRDAVELVDGHALCEASGGVNLNTIRAIVQSGVDIVSVGALTHSARALDIGLDVEIKT